MIFVKTKIQRLTFNDKPERYRTNSEISDKQSPSLTAVILKTNDKVSVSANILKV